MLKKKNNPALFVGDKPSRLNTDPNIAFRGTPSFKNLKKWIIKLEVDDYDMINSEGLRVLNTYRIVIALGNEASERLTSINVKHFKLPHPSPKNRKLNNQSYIDKELEKCYSYIRSES